MKFVPLTPLMVLLTQAVRTSMRDDPYKNPRIEFDHPQDHPGYGQADLGSDVAQVKIEMHQAGDGPLCMLHDWATVHWKAYQNDRLVEDSRSWEQSNGTPKVFRLGHYEVSKCWDIAL